MAVTAGAGAELEGRRPACLGGSITGGTPVLLWAAELGLGLLVRTTPITAARIKRAKSQYFFISLG